MLFMNNSPSNIATVRIATTTNTPTTTTNAPQLEITVSRTVHRDVDGGGEITEVNLKQYAQHDDHSPTETITSGGSRGNSNRNTLYSVQDDVIAIQ